MLVGLFAGLVGGVLGVLLVRPMVRRRLRAVGKAEASLRVIRGSLPGLHPSWRHGVAALSPGSLEFTSYVGGVRFLPRKPVTVPVTDVDLASRRGLAGAERVKMHPGCVIVNVRSGEATLELAVLGPAQLTWTLERLGLS